MREVLDSDWPAIREFANLAVPWAQLGNEMWLEARRNFDAPRYGRRQYVAYDGGTLLGYAAIEGSDVPGRCRVFLVMAAEHLNGAIGARMYCRLLDDADASGVTKLWLREDGRDRVPLEFAESLGYREVMRFRWEESPDGPVDVVSLEVERGDGGFRRPPFDRFSYRPA